MSKFNRVICIGLFVGLIIAATFTLMQRAEAQQQNAGFLSSPYFGTSYVSSVFDHEYPLYDREIRFPNDDDPTITTTIRHNNGIAYTNTVPGYSGHDGIDYALRYQYVLASHAGTVNRSGWDNPANHRSRLGLRVQLETNRNGQIYRTDYGHLSAVWVSQNAIVDRSDLLGISGSTGSSTGPHLHFSVSQDTNDSDMNPYGWNSDTVVDPWSQPNTGNIVSNNLWVDRDGDETIDYPNITNNNVYTSGAALDLPDSPDPLLTPNLTAVTTHIIDDDDPEFTTTGAWQTPACAAADCSGFLSN